MGGYSPVDNGYARFNHVRIPRGHMLSAFASVTPDGEYVQPPHAKLSYGGVSRRSAEPYCNTLCKIYIYYITMPSVLIRL